ncbi:sensor histidine kinase [Microbacterium sp.]|jgi:two-component system sensor histidine kinase SenX3|uniref:sensor histidine kinase n=1 Tax=Microbacterium sp. TaxID=51671 RepID=UPI0037C62328
MDPVQIALLALLAGAVIGLGVSTLVFAALRAAERAEAEAAVSVPSGVLQVLDAMEGAASVVDASLTVVAASPAAPGFGMSAGEVISVEDLRVLVRATRTSGGAESARFRMRRAAGGTALLATEGRLVSARAASLDGTHVLLVVDDVTEQERLEQMRYDFVANTSHELKTPVGAVSLLAEAIESAADDPPQVRAFAVRLQAEAARLSRLTSRIMDLSRLQAADELPEPRDVSIDEVVAASVESNAVQADSVGVELLRGGDRGAIVRGDPTMLIEAVSNLIANAVAYSPKGGRVGVGVRVEDKVVEIAVTDQGIGIVEADQQRIFERFYRADGARSRRTGGTGLGLAIVKHAVQRHGGEVRVWSQPGRGSTFTIRLPRASSPEETEKPRRRRKGSDSTTRRKANETTKKRRGALGAERAPEGEKKT